MKFKSLLVTLMLILFFFNSCKKDESSKTSEGIFIPSFLLGVWTCIDGTYANGKNFFDWTENSCTNCGCGGKTYTLNRRYLLQSPYFEFKNSSKFIDNFNWKILEEKMDPTDCKIFYKETYEGGTKSGDYTYSNGTISAVSSLGEIKYEVNKISDTEMILKPLNGGDLLRNSTLHFLKQ